MQGPDAQYEFILESSTGADEAFINHDTATTLEIYTANLYTGHIYIHGTLIYMTHVYTRQTQLHCTLIYTAHSYTRPP